MFKFAVGRCQTIPEEVRGKRLANLWRKIRSLSWTREQNFGRRIAPVGVYVSVQYSTHLEAMDLEAAAAAGKPVCNLSKKEVGHSPRRWCQQFRQRWDLSFGS